MSRFAHPALFRASAFDGRGDEWTSDTLHLRVRVSGVLGFPISPFAAWRIGSTEVVEAGVRWVDRRGKVVNPPFDPAAVGGVIGIVFLAGDQQEDEWYWLAVDADPHDGDFRVEVLDRRSRRVLAARRKPPYEFGGTAMCVLRVRGRGEVRGVRGLPGRFIPVGTMDGQPALTFGLPLPAGPWYTGSPDPLGNAKDRLFFGADKRLGPQDRPDGAAVPLDAGAEVGRVLDALAPAPGMMDEWLKAAYRDPATPPPLVLREASEMDLVTAERPSPPVRTAKLSPVDALLTMAVEPRVARYLGLATAPEPPLADLKPKANIWLVAGQWAVRPGQNRRLPGWLDLGRGPRFLPGHLDALFPGAAEIKQRYLGRANEGWELVCQVAVACAAGEAPPDVPDAPGPVADSATWNPRDGGGLWTQRVRLPDPPPGMVAAARLRPGTLTPLHRKNPDGRSAPLLVAPDKDGVRVVTDSNVPEDPGGGEWRVWQADEWGRWSGPGDVAAPEPARPAPPPPRVEDWFTPAAAVDDDAPRSPGVLRLRIGIPPAANLAPGGRPLKELRLTSPGVSGWRFGGAAVAGSQAAVLVAGPAVVDGMATVEADVVPTARAATVALTVSAKFADADNRESEATEAKRDVHDPRPPRVVVTAPRVIWCSQPDATGRSELAVEWDAEPTAAGYRVYLGDERRLADTLGLGVDERVVRAERARRVWDRAGDVRAKGDFTLLTETPIAPAGGVVRFRGTLPGTLRGVQFVRVVPVSPGGVEATFERCGLVPVAIPSSERPPVPVVRVTPATDGTATVRIEAPGLRPDLVAGGAAEFRLRRTRGSITDPLFIPVVRTGTLGAVAGGGHGADVKEGEPVPLPAFVRHTWVVEVRYAPEPDLAPGAVAVPGGIRPAWGTPPGPGPGAWSDPSLPASTVIVPVAPTAPAGATFRTNADGSATVRLPAGPALHPRAVGRYTAVVYRFAAGPPTPLAPVPLTGSPVEVTDSPAAEAYKVLVVDPVGRTSPAAAVDPGA